jgi:SAM-dependent methyltransferase
MNTQSPNLNDDPGATDNPSVAFAQTHPDRLSVIAALVGLSPPPVDRCRVLEIGCGAGGNLAPMAEQLPGATFLGMDASGQEIARGTAIIRELGLTNIELQRRDLMDLAPGSGDFDYIIAHGFYSWAPAEMKARILAICQTHLSPSGLAFISYSVMPGAVSILVAREMMRYRDRGASDDHKRQELGKDVLDFVVQHTPAGGGYRELLQESQTRIAEARLHRVLHDDMKSRTEPFYFRQFVAEASRFNLAYVGDSDLPDISLQLAAPLRQRLASLSSDPIDCEQYLDFLVNRKFRCSVLCRREAFPAATKGPAKLREGIWVLGTPSESPAGIDSQGRELWDFGNGDSKVRLADAPPVETLRAVRRAWPGAVPFEQLVEIAMAHSPGGQKKEMIADAIWKVIVFCAGMQVIELSTRARSQ